MEQQQTWSDAAVSAVLCSPGGSAGASNSLRWWHVCLLLTCLRHVSTLHWNLNLHACLPAVVEGLYTTAAWPTKVGGQYGKSVKSAGGLTLTWWVDNK